MPTVRDVSALRLGLVRVRPDNIAATWRPMLWWTATARHWSPWLPVHAFVIRHDGGVLLFDTGQSPASLTDPGYYPRGVVGWAYRRQAQFQIPPEDHLEARLASVGYSPSDVDTVVLSHLHQDHAGNCGLLTHARILASAPEVALLTLRSPEAHGVLAERLVKAGVRLTEVPFAPLPHSELPVDLGHDLYGDGTFTLLPTPGHSPGSMSLLVRRAAGAPLLLVGDATYDVTLMERGVIPGTGARATQRATTRTLNALREQVPGLRIIAAHDPRAATLLA